MGLQLKADRQPMVEMNLIPLIDVMLVLLVIFLVTAPLLTHVVKIDLPKAASAPPPQTVESIQLAIRADGSLFWEREPVAESALSARFQSAAQRSPQPELHIHADARSPYEHVARAMALAARAGLSRIGFVTDPSISP